MAGYSRPDRKEDLVIIRGEAVPRQLNFFLPSTVRKSISSASIVCIYIADSIRRQLQPPVARLEEKEREVKK